MAQLPPRSLALLTWLHVHRFALASQFGLRIFNKDEPKKGEDKLQYPGDHAIALDGDPESSTPAAYLAIATSTLAYQKVKWFITNETNGTFNFLNPGDTFETSIHFVPDSLIILFKVKDTGIPQTVRVQPPSHQPMPNLLNQPEAIASLETVDNIADGLSKVRALLQEFLPENKTFHFTAGDETNSITKKQLMREIDQLFQLRNFLNFNTNG